MGRQIFDAGLQKILESKSIVKFVFDCRNDSDSLWHEYSAKLQNVIDLQLWEYLCRSSAGTNLLGPSCPRHHRRPMICGMNATMKTYVKLEQL